MKIEEGKIYIINTGLCPGNGICGEPPDFSDFDGTEITCFNIEDEDEETFCYNGWYFDKEVLVEVGRTFERVLKEDTRTYTNFKIGDLVEIRTIDNLQEHFYHNDNYIFTKPHKTRNEEIKRYQNRIGIIKHCVTADEDEFEIAFEDGKIEIEHIIISGEALEIVEPGYTERLKREIMERVNIPKEDDEKIIKEMIKKVDVAKIKKILAGAYRMKASEFLGIDRLLLDWARAKKDIYLALGKNLTISKSIEYAMSGEDARANLAELKRKFPRILYCF